MIQPKIQFFFSIFPGMKSRLLKMANLYIIKKVPFNPTKCIDGFTTGILKSTKHITSLSNDPGR